VDVWVLQGRWHCDMIDYLKNAIAEAEHVDFHNGLEKQTVITTDGTDITETVEKAVEWLTEHSF